MDVLLNTGFRKLDLLEALHHAEQAMWTEQDEETAKRLAAVYDLILHLEE